METHGTYRDAQTHWRTGTELCGECLAAVGRYQKRRKFDLANGHARKVSAAQVRAHLQALNLGGMTDGSIASRAGVSISSVRDARIGKNTTILTAIAEALLGVTLEPHPEGWVNDTGSRRRLQALAVLGWSKAEVAAAAQAEGHHLTRAVLGWILQDRSEGGRVRVRTQQGIAAAYTSLSMRIPEPGRGPGRVRAGARNAGWLPPLAWDDIDLDDGPVVAESTVAQQDHLDHAVVRRVLDTGQRPRKLTRAESMEVVTALIARGLSTHRIENDYGLKVERYHRVGKVA